jgi:transposase
LFGVSVASVVKVVATVPGDGQRGGVSDGRASPRSLLGERGWLLDRLAAKPDLTLRALVSELAERGTTTSYGAVWLGRGISIASA